MRVRQNPPQDFAATIHDRRTGAEVARLDVRHGLVADADVRALPWSTIEQRYHVRAVRLEDADALVRAALELADELPQVRDDQRRADVRRLDALVRQSLEQLP